MTLIPEKSISQHVAILGKAGSGKTYAAKGVAENILTRGGRVCIIDPTGVWWGLRSKENGKKSAFPIVIFGGRHQDVALHESQGKAIAEIVGTTDTSVIIDTRQMSVGERTRFFADFAETLLQKNQGPLHLIIDEAHVFAPQGRVNDPQSGKMLNATNNLVSLGRAAGLRVMLITQRPAKLHKDSLTQAETLIAMRLIAPQDRNAVSDWVEEWAEPAQGKEIMKSLPSLPTGEGWIWAPEQGVLKRVKFPKITTYDSSSAPDGKQADVVLANIDLPAIQQRLETVAKETLENDPKRLRAKIAELEKASKKAGPIADPQAINNARSEGWESGYAQGFDDGIKHMKPYENAIMKIEKDAAAALNMVGPPEGYAQKSPKIATLPVKYVPKAQKVSTKPAFHATGAADESLSGGEKALLIVLAQYPNGCTREQLTVISGYKRSSRDTYLQRLKGRGYILIGGDRIQASDEGVQALGGDFEPLPTGEELRAHWLEKLPEGESKILDLLMQAYPDGVDRDALSEATGYKRSSRDTYLQRLRSRQLIDASERGTIKASDDLFQD